MDPRPAALNHLEGPFCRALALGPVSRPRNLRPEAEGQQAIRPASGRGIPYWTAD